MDISAKWTNDYLDPPATPEEQGELLTQAGFPLEGREDLPDGDVRQDFEMTSNRGDCLCHLGLAREITALSGDLGRGPSRRLKVPGAAPKATGPDAGTILKVTNRSHDLCPLYTAHVIRGVKVAPSPGWLAERIEARGDIPRNNLVDATNFVLFELGQPTHVFDLAKLAGPEIIVRPAEPNEPFLPIGEGEHEVKLTTDDLVIADAKEAVAIAGVKGGALSAITEATTDIVLEAATFNPVSVRNSSRRHQISSDSSYRFERGVHPAQIQGAADRLAQVILELCGGELCEGVVADGAPIPEPRGASMRTDRCRALLGVPVTDEQMLDGLGRLGFSPKLDGGIIHCVVPVQRLDIEREIDLIEEVGRVFGHDNIPVSETLEIRVAPPQPNVLARRAVNDALVGMGFVEAITHSLVSEQAATPMVPAGSGLLRVAQDRAGADDVLQPSLLPSLLRVRALNHDNGVNPLRVFETGVAFWSEDGDHREEPRLALLMDVEQEAEGLRPLRGVVERLASIVAGHETTLELHEDASVPWVTTGARLSLSGERLGWMGTLAPELVHGYGLEGTLMAAEVCLPRWYDTYPPLTEAHALPSFPAIERDLSVELDEQVTWDEVRRAIDGLDLEHVETVDFVTTYRGKQIKSGRKSLTLRVRFRRPDRTLKHEEVDPQIASMVRALEGTFQAVLAELIMDVETPEIGLSGIGSLTVDEMLAAVAAKTPAPGGGAVAPVTAALGAALGQMVVNYSIGKKSLAGNDALHRDSIERLAVLMRETAALADADAEAYLRLNGLQKLDARDERRVREWPAAVQAAIDVPQRTLEMCAELTAHLARLDGRTNKWLRSDLVLAAILAEAAARSSAVNVRINLPLLENEAEAKRIDEKVQARVDEIRRAVAEIESR